MCTYYVPTWYHNVYIVNGKEHDLELKAYYERARMSVVASLKPFVIVEARLIVTSRPECLNGKANSRLAVDTARFGRFINISKAASGGLPLPH